MYHRMDLDGFCSLAIAMRYFGPHNLNKTYKVLGYHYGDAIDFTQFSDAESFVFMDVFPSPYKEMYDKFHAITADITVLDHHKTFIESDVPEYVKVHCTTEYSGCEITWRHYNTTPMPLMAELLGRYDRWDNTDTSLWDTTILPFQYGAKGSLPDPSHEWCNWGRIFGTDEVDADVMFRAILNNGEILLQDSREQNRKVMANNAFDATFNNLRVLACNNGSFSSQLFESMWDPDKYDAMLGFRIGSNGTIHASLYATDDAIDCTPVAKLYGGGGHPHACGFSTDRGTFFTALIRRE